MIKNKNEKSYKKLNNKLFILFLSLYLLFFLVYADTNGTKETEEASRRSNKVIMAESSTNIAPRSAIKTLKKSQLKSTSSSNKEPVVLDVKAIEVRSPSPIPEDLIGEEINKQSTSSAMSDQEKKGKKENTQEQQRRKNEETSEKKTVEEQKEEESVKDENKCQKLGNTEENNSDNTGQETSETNKETNIEKYIESDTKERKTEVASVQTTKLRGKSKATGQIVGGWI